MHTPYVEYCLSAETRCATDGSPPVVVWSGTADFPYVMHQYTCHACGLVMNRDLNAAVNLKHLAEKPPAGKALQVDHVRPTA